MKKGRTGAPAKDIDDYLASLPEVVRVAFERLRRTIKAAAPKATEDISYGIPVFKHHGMLVGFAAFETHCSFFVMSPSVMKKHARELKSYDTSKGTIRFQTNKPLPTSLVKKLVKARLQENESRLRKRKARTADRRFE